jgi:hypothetical protein
LFLPYHIWRKEKCLRWIDGLSLVFGYFYMNSFVGIITDGVFGLDLDEGGLLIEPVHSGEFAQFSEALPAFIEYDLPPLLILQKSAAGVLQWKQQAFIAANAVCTFLPLKFHFPIC